MKSNQLDKKIKEIYRCQNIQHNNYSLLSGQKCAICNKHLQDSWLPFDSSSSPSIKIYSLIDKSKILNGTQLLHIDLNLDNSQIEKETMFGFIDLNKIYKKNPQSQLLNNPLNRSSYDEWKSFYQEHIDEMSLKLRNIYDVFNKNQLIDYIITPESKSEFLRKGLLSKFNEAKGAIHINLKKVNDSAEASNTKDSVIQFKNENTDFKGKTVLILDDCVSEYKTFNGIVESLKNCIDSTTNIHLCVFLFNDIIKNISIDDGGSSISSIFNQVKH